MTGRTGDILKVALVTQVNLWPDRHGMVFGNFLDDIFPASAFDPDWSFLHSQKPKVDVDSCNSLD